MFTRNHPPGLSRATWGIVMNRVGVLILALILSGCANHPVDCAIGFAWYDCLPGTAGYRQNVSRISATMESDYTRCVNYGFKEGTPDFARCIQAIDMGRTQNNQAVLQALLAANVANRPATPAPYYVPTTPSANCTSNRIGNTVNTNCN